LRPCGCAEEPLRVATHEGAELFWTRYLRPCNYSNEGRGRYGYRDIDIDI